MNHVFHAQILPLRANKVVCARCGKINKIGLWPTGKRSKCSRTKTRPYKGNAR